jgi:Fe-S-cluster containining protein
MSPRKTARRLLPLYKKHVGPWAASASGMASCKRGCVSCCHNLVGASLAEGVLLASRLDEDPALRRDAAAITAALRAQLSFISGLDASKPYGYLAAKIPCAFLDPETKDCRVYEHRPTACRTYYVVSDPEQCSPDRPGAEVAYVDAGPVVDELTRALLDETPGIPPVAGALQAMVLLGAEMLSLPREEFDRLLASADTGI